MFTQLYRRLAINPSNVYVCRCLHTTAVNKTFWEREKKSGYAKKYPLLPTKQNILDGLKELKSEIQLWKEEIKEKLEGDPILVYRPGEVDIAWKFSGNCYVKSA